MKKSAFLISLLVSILLLEGCGVLRGARLRWGADAASAPAGVTLTYMVSQGNA